MGGGRRSLRLAAAAAAAAAAYLQPNHATGWLNTCRLSDWALGIILSQSCCCSADAKIAATPLIEPHLRAVWRLYWLKKLGAQGATS